MQSCSRRRTSVNVAGVDRACLGNETHMNVTPQAAPPATETRPAATSAILLLSMAALLFVSVTVVGLLLSRELTPSPVSRLDERVIEWFADQRTPTLNTLTNIGQDFAMTLYVFALTVVVAVVLRLWLGRWRESLALVVCVLGEWILFRLVNAAVDRQRPGPMLDGGALTASFPSGHAGMAVAFYGGLALILLRSVMPRKLAISIASFCLAVILMVAITRWYRGMHFPTDVLGSWLLAGTWVLVVVTVLLPRHTTAAERTGGEAASEHPGLAGDRPSSGATPLFPDRYAPSEAPSGSRDRASGSGS
jgi:membrane-associated phospholipid phosphatase